MGRPNKEYRVMQNSTEMDVDSVHPWIGLGPTVKFALFMFIIDLFIYHIFINWNSEQTHIGS